MVRPCFLVVDQEHAGSISTRKLVIETAKFNVITAYSGEEALESLRRFPRVSGLVLDAGITDIACNDMVREIKKLQPQLPIVVVGRPSGWECDGADHYLQSFEPARLIQLLRRLEPEQSAIILGRESELVDGDA